MQTWRKITSFHTIIKISFAFLLLFSRFYAKFAIVMKTNLQIVYITFVITMLSVFHMQAQTDIIDWESSFQTIEDVDEEEVENLEMQYEELSDLIEHKIDINSATREDLLRLPFLSNQQVMDIMEYMYHYGSMKSLAELAMIRSIDYETRQLLAQCLFVGDKNEEKKFPSLYNIAK